MRKLFFVIRVVVVSYFLSFIGTEAIQVTFLVTVPFETATADTVYIMGSEPELGDWDPDKVPLSKNPDGSWQIELDLPQKTIFYHYTKGSWFYIEKGKVGEAINVRMFTVPDSDVVVNDTVFKWGQFGPYLSWVNDPKTTMVVSWGTEDSGDFTVEYGFDTTYGFSVSDATVGTLHSFELTGLNPSTTYHYKVSSSSGEMSVDNTFSTAIYQYEPFTFVAYGDTRTNDGDRAAVVKSIIDINPDIIFNTGDLVGDGTEYDYWRTWFSTNQDILDHIPYFVAIGNHEMEADLYYDIWHFPGNEQWYSIDYGNAHFVCLNTNIGLNGVQRDWLEADLESASQIADWIFVFFHHPPYSSGNHGSDIPVRNAWCSLFEDYGVDIVFNGHDHDYERSLVNGVYYIVTGGGGAPLRPVGTSEWTIYSEMTLHCCEISIDSLQLDLKAIKPDGTVFDSFLIYTGIDEDTKPERIPYFFKVSQNHPNPFTNKTEIRYELPAITYITISVYNLAGQLLRTLEDGYKKAGYYTITWDGKNEDGIKLKNGIYFCNVKAIIKNEENLVDTKKMLLVR